jgi:hypothetical protein
MKRMLLVVAALFGAAFLAAAARAEAEPPGLFEVLISYNTLAQPVGYPPGSTLGQATGFLTVYAEGAACTGADLSSASGDVLLVIGRADQPAACSRDGAWVTFTRGDGFPLSQSMVLRLGARQELSDFAPAPPEDYRPAPPVDVKAGLGPYQPQTGGRLGFPRGSCDEGGGNVGFAWQPLGAGPQWLDIGLDESFAPGRFVSAGPFPANAGIYKWEGLQPGVAHFWRVNTLTQGGWMVSETAAFVPCGAPVLLWGPLFCRPDGSVEARLRWAPSVPAAFEQWVDISREYNGFVPGTYDGFGPLSGTTIGFVATNIDPRTTYFFRVSALTSYGWLYSTTAGFRAASEGVTCGR